MKRYGPHGHISLASGTVHVIEHDENVARFQGEFPRGWVPAPKEIVVTLDEVTAFFALINKRWDDFRREHGTSPPLVVVPADNERFLIAATAFQNALGGPRWSWLSTAKTLDEMKFRYRLHGAWILFGDVPEPMVVW